MSDNIPLEIQTEIIKRLPVKSVVQFSSVSKLWKSLIDSSKFISSYNRPQRHLFVRYRLAYELKCNYVSVVDDDNFPNQISSLTVPHPVSLLKHMSTFYSVNGLLCNYGSRQDATDDEKIAVLWNPSVRKAVGITISNPLLYPTGYTLIGFGVCPNTSDPKLVRINTIGSPTVENWEVEVFTLSTRVWKTVSNIPPAFNTCHVKFRNVCIDGFIYWLAYDSIKRADGSISNLIISFDLKSDDFGEVCLPDRLVHTDKLEVSKVYESLGLFEYYNDGKTRGCDVWIMKEGVTKSFTKILSIKAPDTWVGYNVLEIRKNGEAIVENFDMRNHLSALEVYNPSSGSISGLVINGAPISFLVNSYMETLLLLDESNSIIH